MKLVGELKESVSKAKGREEAKEIIEKAGIVLTDEEMDMVSGGNNPVDTYIDGNADDEPSTYINRMAWW